MSLLQLAALAFLLCVAGSQGQYNAVCNSSNYFGRGKNSTLKFPELPNQFSMKIEATLIESNSTEFATELFDEPGNRGRITIASGDNKNTLLTDYADNLLFVYPSIDDDSPCTTQPINLTNFVVSSFGFQSINGTAHIGSVRHLFQVPPNDSYLYLGKDIVRGIPTNHFQTCTVNSNSSFTLDYWFSEGHWEVPYADPVNSALVKVELNTKRVPRFPNDVTEVHHIYSVVEFKSGPDSVPDEHFALPLGLPCKGRKDGKPLPELPTTFSMSVEQTTQFDGSIFGTSVFKQYYDYNLSLLRYDRYTDKSLTVVHDFNQEVQYIIDRQYGNCSVSPLTPNNSFYDGRVGEDGFPVIGTFSQLYFLDYFNFSYQGETTLRGMKVDSWIAYTPLLSRFNASNALFQLYFTKPGTVITNEYFTTFNPVLWAMTFRGELYQNEKSSLLETELDIFGFSGNEPPYDAFDTSICVDPSDYVILPMVISNFPTGIDIINFRKEIRLSVANFAKIPPLQIGNIQIIGQSNYNDRLIVTFHISNLTSFARVENPKTANQVLMEIINATLENGAFPFSFELAPGVIVTPTRMQNPIPTSVPNPSATPIKCALSTGGIVGLSIGMVILGVLLGIGVTLLVVAVVWCSRSKGEFKLKGATRKEEPYTRQMDEITES